MSQSGNLTFFSRQRPVDPRVILRSIMGFLNPTSISIISRTRGEDQSWADFRAERDPPSTDLLPRITGWAGIDNCYREGAVLTSQLDDSPVGLGVSRAIEVRIPKAIRGEFAPGDPIVTIGWHDLWECAEHDEGFFIARAFLSVGFFGYFTPNNWKGFREAVFGLAEVKAVELQLSEIVGEQLEHAVYWSI